MLEKIYRNSDGEIRCYDADADGNHMAIVFGTKSGAAVTDMMFDAAREAHFLHSASCISWPSPSRPRLLD